MKEKLSFGISTILLLLIIQLQACTGIFHSTSKYILYPVQSGDTVVEIAERFNVSNNQIQELNNISNVRDLRAGSIIKIPYLGQDLARGSQPQKAGSSSNKISKGTIGSVRESNFKVPIGIHQNKIGTLIFPVKAQGSYINSSFGWRWLSFHEGIDIVGAEGSPIYSAHAGEVVHSGRRLSGYGNMIVIKSGDLMTVYGHNKKNRVSTGDFVKQGQHIADLGQTGKASGPHCHFETRIKNSKGKYVAVDPLVFFKE